MKKANSGDGGSLAKANVAPKTVDEYLACVPEPARGTLMKVRAAIRSAVPPEATEAIGYRMPAFRYTGTKREREGRRQCFQPHGCVGRH